MIAYVIKSKPHQTRDRATVSKTNGVANPVMRFFTPTALSENMHETPEGYLLCMNVPIARTGEQIYGKDETPLEPGHDGTVVIDRTADEVFRPETMASFEGKPFTIYHPEEFVGPDNWNELTVGIAQNVRRGSGEFEGSLLADILITAKRAIQRVKDGLREISCGYDAEYVQTGIGRGRQKNILGNHVALVDEGRAGSSHAIKDHKGKGSMSIKNAIKGIFGKAQDDALKLVSQTDGANDPGDDDDDADAEGVRAKALDKRMDRIEKLLGKVLKAKTKDFMEAPSQVDPAQPQAGGSVEERMKKLEEMVASLMERFASESADADEEEEKPKKSEDEEEVEVESEDADEEESEEESEDEMAEDEDYEGDEEKGKKKTGDTASRLEILAPGMKASVKDAKKKALIKAFSTKDGKKAILKLTGGAKPKFDDKSQVEMLFIGASELLSNDRSDAFAATRTRDSYMSSMETPKGAMTADEINAVNAKHYAQK